MSGRVVHFEIPYDDADRARGFYRDAFGWEIQPMPEMDYTMVSSGPSGEQGPSESGFINGGMMARDQSPSPGPILVVDVDDLEKALETVGGLGGSTLVGKQAVGDMGFVAYFKDSEGNVVGLWQNA